MKAQTKAIVASLVVIALALSAVSGVTYSWWSDTEQTEIDVTTGQIDIVTVLSNSVASSVGMGEKVLTDGDGSFPLGGTIDTTQNALGYGVDVNNMAPGDSIEFEFSSTITNSIKVMYNVSANVVGTGGLEPPIAVTIEDTQNNKAIDASETSTNTTTTITITMDEDAGNEYQGLQYAISLVFGVYQYNSPEQPSQSTTVGGEAKEVVVSNDNAGMEATVAFGDGSFTTSTDVTVQALSAVSAGDASYKVAMQTAGTVLGGIDVEYTGNLGANATVTMTFDGSYPYIAVYHKGNVVEPVDIDTYTEPGKTIVSFSASSFSAYYAVDTSEAAIGDEKYLTLGAAIEAAKSGDTVVLKKNVSRSDILVIDKSITLDGNGHTLTSTAGRAINVSGADGVTIKNITIECTGERGINIIQNSTNVSIVDCVITANNYTVNVAASAGAAEVEISGSTLNGLCTVNVSGAGAYVLISDSTVNCNDNNPTKGESYAALSLNKDAIGGSIIATDTIVNVAAGSDSYKGRNSPQGGTVEINDSIEDVIIIVAVITYENSDYSYSFTTLQGAIEFAKDGDAITLLRDILLTEPLVIDKSITLDLDKFTLVGFEGKTVISIEDGASLTIKGGSIEGSGLKECGDNVIENSGTLVLDDVTIKSTAANGASALYNEGTATVTGCTLNGALYEEPSWPSYTVNNAGILTITDSKMTSYHGSVASYGAGAVVTLNNSEIDMNGIPGFTSHGMYTYNDGKIIVNGGTYANKATDQSSTDGSVINGFVEINGGTFSGRIANYYGTPVITAGTFTVDPSKWVSDGYTATPDGNGTWTVTPNATG